jgi:excisionase family DNA binding protein
VIRFFCVEKYKKVQYSIGEVTFCMNSTFDKALTPEDVAKFLQFNVQTIYRKIRKGEIPAKKIGKDYRISPTYLHYFRTGLDYDIYQHQLEDQAAITPHLEDLKSIRKQLQS